MRIVAITSLRLTGLAELPGDHGRGVDALDIYPEFGQQAWQPTAVGIGPRRLQVLYLRISTDQGVDGVHGPISPEQYAAIRQIYRGFLIGRDPRPANLLWDQLMRLDRHGRTGLGMMAISAIDNALWDIRGKLHGVPVHRLLGGPTRERIPAYATSYPDLDPAVVAERARALVAAGYVHQKWFFRFGPGDGWHGMERNLAMAAALRQAVGDEVDLMFDCRRAWDLPYAVEMLRGLEPLRPRWVEEPLMAGQLDAHRRLRQAVRVPIATGEHLYTRWEAKPYCDEHLIDYLQVDPEWCGGITEWMKIAYMAEATGVAVLPHGRLIAPAAQVAAAVSPTVCPLLECIVGAHLPAMQHFNLAPLLPVDGQVTLPDTPGMGIAIDMTRVEHREELD